MRWFSKKPFIALLLSLVIASFLPLLDNSIYFVRFQAVVQEQQEQLAEESLKLSIQQVDRTLQELSVLAVKLSKQYSNHTIPPTAAMDVSCRLELHNLISALGREMEASSEHIDFLYIYTHGSDNIITNKSVFEHSHFYQKFFQNKPDSRQILEQLHTTFSYGSLYPLPEGRSAYLRTITRASSGQPEMQLVLVLKKSFFTDTIEKMNPAGGILALESKDGLLAISNKSGVLHSPADLSQLFQDETDQAPDRNGMIIYSLHSSVSDLLVRAALPSSLLWQKSRELRYFYMLFLILAASLALGLAFLLARRNVLPINQLINHIKKHYQTGNEASQGLEQIKETIDSLLVQQSTNLAKLSEYESMISKNRLRELLRGNSQDDGSLPLPANARYIVVCFWAVETPLSDQNDLVIRSQEALPLNVFRHSMAFDDNVVQVIGQTCASFGETEAEQYLTAQLDWLDGNSGTLFHAGYSQVHQTVASLDRAYNEASMALLYAANEPDVALVSFSSCKFETASFLRDWQHLDKQLLFARLLGEADVAAARQLLPSLFPAEFLDDYFPASDIAQLRLSSLQYQFIHDFDAISKLFSLDQEVLNGYLHELIYCKSHRDLYCLLERLFCEINKDVPSVEPDVETDQRVLEIKQYIEQNYADPQLSVAFLAQVYSLSANNLSQLFSRKSDCGVLDYIHKVRLNVAAVMLKNDKKMVIQDIAQHVGYTSVLTFNRKFRAEFAKTPSEYRKSAGN